MTPVYLSDILKASGPIDFEFIARGAPQQGTSKAGKPYQFWEYTVRSRSTGQQSVERLFEFDHKKFAGIVAGQLMRASINAKGFVQWDPSPTGEAVLQQPHNNSREVRGERQYTEQVQARDEAKELKDIQICLQGYSQAYIIQGKNGEEALKLAEEDRARLLRRSSEIRIGVGPMSHSPAQIQEVNEKFGTDQSAPLPDDMREFNE